MECAQINPTGNFENWSPSRLRELQTGAPSTSLGQKLLLENHYVRIWEVILFPNERLPFRKIQSDYSLVAHTDGLLLSRCGCRAMHLRRFKKGATEVISHECTDSLEDMENIGDETLILNIIEFRTLNRFTYELNNNTDI
ncbi:MAG: hypothetical protein E4H26_02870 [Flavobacteriales bacterium]|nr:MAG: hypothetical protein E4H26_02870 [Flavobacteriales bacterium]